jgi:ADP-heptose:LPS heptosyltransferase
MRILCVNSAIELLGAEGKVVPLKAQTDYVVPDIVIMLLQECGFGQNIIKNDDFYDWSEHKNYAGQRLDNKEVVFFRNGGIGDLIFPIPSAKALKEKYPTCKIYVCCNEWYRCLFEELDFIEGVYSLPLPMEEIWKKDYYINFEGLIEGNPNKVDGECEAEVVDAYTLHSKKFHVTPDNLCPELKVNPEAEKLVKAELSKYAGMTKIVIAFSASVAIRSADPALYKSLIDSVDDPNVRWFITGSESQIVNIKNFIKTCKNKNKIINWSEKHKDLVYSMALVKNADCVIAPDSGLLHIAGGFGIPVIGLYGAFHSSLRMKHYKKAIGLNTSSSCVFARGKFRCCFQHGNGKCNLAKKYHQTFPPCMDYIKVDAIKGALKTLGVLYK